MPYDPPNPAEADWKRCMRRGDFESAWRINDQVLRTDPPSNTRNLPLHLQRIWEGEPLEGKRVLVRFNHGLGDTIQFSRYLPLVSDIATNVDVAAQPSLFELLGSVRGISRIIDRGARLRSVYDVEIEAMELPYAFRSTLETIPAAVPYMFVESDGRKRRTDDPQIGVVWKAGDWDERRSMPFPELLPLFDLVAADFHILQLDAQSAGWMPGYGRIAECGTVTATAKVMKDLDLVISVDTMTAHLAGALGVEVWTLLHADADWRWLADTDKSPWYPTMKLFRQQHPGDWNPVIDNVCGELLAGERRRSDTSLARQARPHRPSTAQAASSPGPVRAHQRSSAP